MIFQNVTIEKFIVGGEAADSELSPASRKIRQDIQMAVAAAGAVTIDLITCVNGGQSVEVEGSASFGNEKADVLLATVISSSTPPADPPADATVFVPNAIDFVIPAVPIGVIGTGFVVVWAYSNKVSDMKSFSCGSSSSSSSSNSSSSSGSPSSSSSSNMPSSSSSSAS